MERVSHLTNKIYREMLCITKKEGGYYDGWTLPRCTWIYRRLSDFAIQDCTFSGLAILNIGGGWNSQFLYQLSYNSRIIWSLVYQPGYLSYPNYRIFTAGNLSVSSFLSTSNIFLIVILLDPPHYIITLSDRTWALENTSPVLFQRKWFFVYSDQCVQNALYYEITLQNWCLIRWRLLLSGFRSVLVIATDKSLQLKIRFVLRDLVPNNRATWSIVSRANFVDT